MRTEFNHAANDSPRSGSSKKATPLVWAATVLVVVAAVLWLTFHPIALFVVPV